MLNSRALIAFPLMCIFVIATASAVDPQTIQYLQRFNFLPRYMLETGADPTVSQTTEAIENLQRLYDLPVTGSLDIATNESLQRLRCGNVEQYSVPDAEPFSINKKNITWKCHYSTSNTSRLGLIRQILISAFEYWEEVLNSLHWSEDGKFQFLEKLAGDEQDIIVSFAAPQHGDNQPFIPAKDMSYGHVYHSNSDDSFQIHLNNITWLTDNEIVSQVSGNRQVRLNESLIHQIGHILGLPHSNERTSPMFPLGHIEPIDCFTLTQSEVDTLHTLHSPGRNDTTPKETTEAPRMMDDICTAEFDAVLRLNDIFLFKGSRMWKVKNDGEVERNNISIHSYWLDLPDDLTGIDAAFTFEGEAVLIRGERYFRMQANRLAADSPIFGNVLYDFGLPYPLVKIDAAFTWMFNAKLYLIAGDKYWRLDQKTDQMFSTAIHYNITAFYPRDMAIWTGVPLPVSDVFTDQNDETYFVHGANAYQIINNENMTIDTSHPINIASRWLKMNCRANLKGSTIKVRHSSSTMDNRKPGNGGVSPCSSHHITFILLCELLLFVLILPSPF